MLAEFSEAALGRLRSDGLMGHEPEVRAPAPPPTPTPTPTPTPNPNPNPTKARAARERHEGLAASMAELEPGPTARLA